MNKIKNGFCAGWVSLQYEESVYPDKRRLCLSKLLAQKELVEMDRSIDRLMYLDREFISSLYEAEEGVSPQAVITRTEGLNAGVQIPLFNAKASSVQSKSYSISASQMLSALKGKLDAYPSFESSQFDYMQPSVTCWVDGLLSATFVEVTRTTNTITFIGKPKKRKGPKKN